MSIPFIGKSTVRVAYYEPLGDQKMCSQYRDFILSELDLIQILCRVLNMVLDHDKRMFILSGFIISDLDCSYTGKLLIYYILVTYF